MSGEQLIQLPASEDGRNKDKSNSKRAKVDINVLLNRVRADKKKEKIESLIFFGMISAIVIISGVIISF